MKDLNNNIIQWADDKGILSNATPLTQIKKTFEELTELITALIDKNPEDVKDAIGDVNVTLIIVSKLAELKPSLEEIGKSNVFITANWIVEIFQKLARNKDISIDVIRAQEALNRLAKENGLTLEECTQSAYEVIAKRTGKLVNGVFVKDEKTTAPDKKNKRNISIDKEGK